MNDPNYTCRDFGRYLFLNEGENKLRKQAGKSPRHHRQALAAGGKRRVGFLLRLLLLPALDFLHERIDHFGFEHVAHDFAVAEDDALSVAGGDADVGFARLAGAVDHAAQHADFHRRLAAFEPLLEFGDDVLEIDGQSAASRTGDQFGLADAPLLASAAGSTLFVIESGKPRTRAAIEALNRLEATGARILGATLTKSEEASGYGRYSHGYGYGYGARARIKQTEILMIPDGSESVREDSPAESEA